MVDLLAPVIELAEKFFGDHQQRRATDMRIADKAQLLRRTLTSSFEPPLQRPLTFNELLAWAHNLTSSFERTEATLSEIVHLRAEASPKIKKAVGVARTEYYAAADLVNPIVRAAPPPIVPGMRLPVNANAQLHRAVAHMRECIKMLDTLTGSKDDRL